MLDNVASEEVSTGLLAHRKVLRSFSLSKIETSVEWNLCHANRHNKNLMFLVAVEDAPERAQVLQAMRESVEQIIEEEQAHRAQLSALLVEHHAILQSLPERPQQEYPQAPPKKSTSLQMRL